MVGNEKKNAILTVYSSSTTATATAVNMTHTRIVHSARKQDLLGSHSHTCSLGRGRSMRVTMFTTPDPRK